MQYVHSHTVKKLITSIIFGLLITGLAPFTLMDAAAQPTLFGIAKTGGGPAEFWMIDPTTGAGIDIGPVGFDGCSGMDQHPQTLTVYATCQRTSDGAQVLITIDPTSGAGTEVGPTGSTDKNPDLSFRNSDNTLYAFVFDFGPTPQSLGTIDINSGLQTTLGVTGDIGGGNSIAFSPGDTLFHSRTFNSIPTLNTLDQNNGAFTFVTNLASGPSGVPITGAMDFQPGTGILFGTSGRSGTSEVLFTIDTNTGIITEIGPTVINIDAIAFIDERRVGGEIIPIDTTSLILAGAQSFSWMIPVVLSVLGIGLFVVSRKSKNS